MIPLGPEDFRAKADARSAWTADRSRLVFLHPLVASLALQLEIIPVVDERLDTAATDGRAVFVNAHWLKTLAPDKRLFVLAHEVWHNALLHLRRGAGRDPRRWNLAIDHEVNGLLMRDGFGLPGDAVHYEEWDELGAEEVYARLSDPSARRLAGLEEDGLPERPRTADVHLGEVPDLAGQGSEGCGPWDFGPIQGKRDPDYPACADPRGAEEWAERVVALERQLKGELPLALRRAVKAVTRPTVPWQLLLRDFIQRTHVGGSRWLPPNRRHVHRGLYLPSRSEERLKLAVALDTSGSTAEDMARFLGELQRIVRSFGRYELRLLQCDAEIEADELYDDSRLLPADVEVVGGGGTDFRPVFERLAPNPPTALVYFTDGFGDAPTRPPPWPVVWVLTPEGQPPVEWGAAVRLEPSPRALGGEEASS